MEDFSTRTYGTSGLDNRPLFGETSAKVSAEGAPGPGVSVRLCVRQASRVLAGPLRGPWRDLEEESRPFHAPASLSRCLPRHSAPSRGRGRPGAWRRARREVRQVRGCWGP